MTSERMPVLYIPHGGGPWPFVDLPILRPAERDALSTFLACVPATLPAAPKALLVISAHWETHVPTVMASERPSILYDYSGFPPDAYSIEWPAHGDPALADRVRDLLTYAGFDTASDSKRGYDHGTFIPLKVMYPEADVPTVQLSILHNLNPVSHFELGQALAPLRDEGVLIIGSGMSYHDLRGFFSGQGGPVSEAFDAWLQEAALADYAHRERRLAEWPTAPLAGKAHPREEHLLPLMVVAGAAGNDSGECVFNGTFGGARISAFRYG